MNTMAKNYVPIIDMPPSVFRVISPTTFNMQQFGISNGSTAGNVKTLFTSTASIGRLSSSSSTKTSSSSGTSSGETFTGSGSFTGGSSGSTATGGGGSSGGNQGGSTGNGGGLPGNGGGSSGNGGGSSGNGGASPGTSGGNNGSGATGGGKTEPPVTLVAKNSAPPMSSGSSLGSISLGSIIQSLSGAGNSGKSLPSIAGQRSPIGVAVVDVGGIEADDPNLALNDTKKKK